MYKTRKLYSYDIWHYTYLKFVCLLPVLISNTKYMKVIKYFHFRNVIKMVFYIKQMSKVCACKDKVPSCVPNLVTKIM
jgi:hypothetical protein